MRRRFFIGSRQVRCFGCGLSTSVDGGQALDAGKFFGEKWHQAPLSQHQLAFTQFPALPNDGLEGGGRDVVVFTRQGQLGGMGSGVEVFRDLLLVAATDIPAKH